tara:strand:- start:18 stop:290 length:273 start_codon:yes stop_codon:yes gene_type:complete
MIIGERLLKIAELEGIDPSVILRPLELYAKDNNVPRFNRVDYSIHATYKDGSLRELVIKVCNECVDIDSPIDLVLYDSLDESRIGKIQTL